MFKKIGQAADMFSKVKDMKSSMSAIQDQIRSIEETVSNNGVSVTINGAHQIISVKIDDPSAAPKSELENAIVDNMNIANQKIVNKSAGLMKEATAGLDFGGLGN